VAVLGIDIGTQSLKAVVLDDDLIPRGEAARSYSYEQPRPGWAEQDPALWLCALRPAIAAAMGAARMQPADIAVLAVCGQLDGCIATDEAGSALTPAIIWMDRRAAPDIVHLDPSEVARRSGLVLDATHMAAKIAWSKRHAPVGAAMWHQPVSFVVGQITGESVLSHSLASTSMLYSLEERDWDDALLRAFGVDAEELPRIASETAIAGGLSRRGAELTGLPAGTPVAVGTGDDFSNPLGCGICEPDVVAVSLGTAEPVSALSDRAVLDPDLLVETHAYPGGLYHLGNPGWLSGGALRWASAMLGLPSDETLIALADTAPPGCDGLVFIPALTGAMAPRWIAEARGSFVGLTGSHGPAHLARAVLEGTAFAMRDVIDRLSTMGLRTGRLCLMGGGARSALWCQIRADVSGRPAEVQTTSDASARGAALIAAVAADLAPTLSDAARSLHLDVRHVEPRIELGATYERAYRCYRRAFSALEQQWTSAHT
jgi:xylulokinase